MQYKRWSGLGSNLPLFSNFKSQVSVEQDIDIIRAHYMKQLEPPQQKKLKSNTIAH